MARADSIFTRNTMSVLWLRYSFIFPSRFSFPLLPPSHSFSTPAFASRATPRPHLCLMAPHTVPPVTSYVGMTTVHISRVYAHKPYRVRIWVSLSLERGYEFAYVYNRFIFACMKKYHTCPYTRKNHSIYILKICMVAYIVAPHMLLLVNLSFGNSILAPCNVSIYILCSIISLL